MSGMSDNPRFPRQVGSSLASEEPPSGQASARVASVAHSEAHPVNVALVGFGTVGSSVARILSSAPSHLRLTHIVNRNVERKRVDWLPNHIRWTDNFEEALDDSVDIVVELVGGLEPAREWVRRALLAGKSVVTANKQLIAHHGADLL